MPDQTDGQSPALIDPTDLWRLLFWLTWVAGTALVLFTWVLLMVPGHVGVMDLIVRSSAAAVLLGAILLGRWLWKILNPFPLTAPRRLFRTFMLIVWLELVAALIEAAGTAVFLAFGH
jgi:hypothetical protein